MAGLRGRFRERMRGSKRWLLLILVGLLESGMSGLLWTLTIFYQFLLVRFGKSETETALTLSLCSLFLQLSSPLAAALIKKFGQKGVAIGAALTLSTSFIITAFAHKLWVVYLSYGVLGGAGITIYIISTVSTIQASFGSCRGRAMAIQGACSFGLGGFYMPILITYLYNQYGFFGMSLIEAGILLNLTANGLLFGILLRDSKQSQSQLNKKSGVQIEYAKTNTDDHVDKADEKENKERAISAVQRENRKQVRCTLSCPRVIRKFGSAIGLPVLRNRTLLMFALLLMVFASCRDSTVVFFSSLAYEKGLAERQLVLTISISSGVNRHRLVVMLVVMHLEGLMILLLPLIPGVVGTALPFIIMDSAAAIVFSQFSTVMVDLNNQQDITSVISMANFFFGIGFIAGPFLGSSITDFTGSHKTAWYISGSTLSILTIVFLVVIRFVQQRDSRTS